MSEKLVHMRMPICTHILLMHMERMHFRMHSLNVLIEKDLSMKNYCMCVFFLFFNFKLECHISIFNQSVIFLFLKNKYKLQSKGL